MMSKNKHLSGGLFMAKPQPLTIRESSLSAQIADYLSDRRIYNDRLQCGKIETKCGSWIHLCKTGTPDRFAIIRGQIIFIEVKKFGKKATPEQLERHEKLEHSGAVVINADSFQNFITQFNEIRRQIEHGETLYK
jgi:hypothetical protein